MDNQPTSQHILDAVNLLSRKVDNIETLNQEILETINTAFTEVEQKMATKEDLKTLEARMATKDELRAMETRIDKRFDKVDEKFADLRGDFVGMLRKEDFKLGTLVGKLGTREVLPLTDVSEVLAMEPFSKTV